MTIIIYNKKNVYGNKYGMLTVIKSLGMLKYSILKVRCKCDCGNTLDIRMPSLVIGRTKSCGCSKGEFIRKTNTKHGLKYTRPYSILSGMKRRCYKNNFDDFKHYGGRGITVCEQWTNKKYGYLNFYIWAMNNGYKDNLSIDRINNDGNYEPDNCKWATDIEQNNRRCNKK